MKQVLAGVLGLGIAAISSAQRFQVGNLPGSPTYQLPGGTLIDLSATSPASGALSSATFTFSSFPCPAAVKIKVFTRPYLPCVRCSGAVDFVDERGPFDVTQVLQTVQLDPPLSIKQGGLIGIASLTGCGHPLGASEGPNLIATYSSDVTSTVGLPTFSTDPQVANETLSLAAFGTQTFFTEVSGTIPVFFNGNGAAASHFRTDLRLYNPAHVTVSGLLRWTPSPTTTALQPISTPYSLSPGLVKAIAPPTDFPSLVCVDIVPSTGPGPAASAHLFNDLGSSGTIGFTESDIPPSEALKTGEVGVLLGPADPINFRLNIGFRAVDVQAMLRVTAFRNDGSGAVFTERQALSFLIQNSFQDLLGIPLEPSMTITFEVSSGTAFVYGVTADNRTNDTSFQLVRRVPR